MTWRDRAALSLLALAGNLQSGRHLSRSERTQAWGIFEALLLRFIDSRFDAQGRAVA
jgi:hypothetical protein